MEAKTGLNNTQRKILEGIYVERLKEKQDTAINARQAQRKQFSKKVVAKALKDPAIRSVKKALENLATVLTKHESKLDGIGISEFPGYNGTYAERAEKMKLYVRDRYDEKHPELQEFDNETESLRDKYHKAIQEVRVKIWGMNVSYEEMEKEIDKVLASL